MKKLLKSFFFIFIFSLLFAVAAYASAEPSGEPSAELPQASGEPSAEPSGEPSGEPADETRSTSFDVTVMVNGAEYTKVPVTITVSGNRYSFQVGELFDALGMEVHYDEQTDVASITPKPESLSAILMAGAVAEGDKGDASGEPAAPNGTTASGEPMASDEPAASAEPVTDGGPSAEPVAASLSVGRRRDMALPVKPMTI